MRAEHCGRTRRECSLDAVDFHRLCELFGFFFEAVFFDAVFFDAVFFEAVFFEAVFFEVVFFEVVFFDAVFFEVVFFDARFLSGGVAVSEVRRMSPSRST